MVINELLRHLNENPTSPSGASGPSSINLTQNQVSELLQCFQQQQETLTSLLQLTSNSPLRTPHLRTSVNSNQSRSFAGSTKPPEYYNNAKYEDIISKPMKPPYDGSSDQLIPFLNRLDIRRQDEGWYPITFLTINNTKYDLIRHFTQIDETVMLQEARIRWTSPTISIDKHTIDHPTFNARVLARLLLSSVTDDFCITIINRVPQDYRNDGPLLLWIICNNIHRNNIAFVESIKRKIRDSTISQFGDDVPKYILHLKDNLRLITSSDNSNTQHNDLITYLFHQLQQCNVPLFKEAIDKWHIEYLEAKLPGLTPEKFLKMVDDKIQILKHADQWKESEHTEIMALKLELQKQKQESDALVKNLVAHVGRLSNAHRNLHHGISHHGHNNKKHPFPGSNPMPNNINYPPWMIVPPQHPMETKLMDRRIYTWCTKCRQGQGLWVCRHNTETHVDGYTNQRNQRRRIDHTTPQFPNPHPTAVDGQRPMYPTSQNLPVTPTAHFSLIDYLDDYLPDNESHAPPPEDEP
jgi:hypothetical protein